MIRNRMHYVLAAALVASIGLVGCKKKEEPVATPAPAPTPVEPVAPTPPPAAATASVTAVDLGSAVGADKKVTTATTTFKPKDTIYVAISTSTSDAAATVPAKLGAKWTFQDGQTVKDDSADAQLMGAGVTNFSINSPKGFPTGKYKVDVSLDGNVVQSKEFEVK
ncbi:hypothetical protein DX914_16085 [Lysobacter silvisoli]|uniref:DUF4625 domain-containing protein n=2 Tax=Lysobacter silvisoli TaxID=2293254 RepID=A0A371JYS5_9GAMM|nr:hypothetical protein DX914_16085 [Lysobacter silvisoli]